MLSFLAKYKHLTQALRRLNPFLLLIDVPMLWMSLPEGKNRC